MTEKRFSLKYIGEQHLSANLYDDKIFIGSIGIGAELVVDLLNDLSEENKQLRQRNINQYNQLTELWEIIEEENWEKLIAMKKQLKEDEERLQKE